MRFVSDRNEDEHVWQRAAKKGKPPHCKRASSNTPKPQWSNADNSFRHSHYCPKFQVLEVQAASLAHTALGDHREGADEPIRRMVFSNGSHDMKFLEFRIVLDVQEISSRILKLFGSKASLPSPIKTGFEKEECTFPFRRYLRYEPTHTSTHLSTFLHMTRGTDLTCIFFFTIPYILTIWYRDYG